MRKGEVGEEAIGAVSRALVLPGVEGAVPGEF